MAVTVPIDNSDGASIVLAIKSQNIQNTEPHKKHAGITTIGFAVFNISLVICGTAIPTNDIGPAKAVTQEDKRLDKVIIIIRNTEILIPTLLAYPSPS